MREIKFRAWIEDVTTGGDSTKQMETFEKLMSYEEPLNPMIDSAEEYHIQGKIIWMQYTGLKDKNGKEIYEGDIVREDNPYTSISKGVKIIFEQELLQFGVLDIDDYFIALCDIKGEWEVIGNIYENPELLEEGII